MNIAVFLFYLFKLWEKSVQKSRSSNVKASGGEANGLFRTCGWGEKKKRIKL